MLTPAFRKGVRAVALFEATKGVLAGFAGIAVLKLLGTDPGEFASDLVERFHLDPERAFAGYFVRAASHLDDRKIWLLAVAALVYALFRFVEAYGLWRERLWAEWLAVATGAIYIPFELYEMTKGITLLRSGVLVANLIVVAFLTAVLIQNARERSSEAERRKTRPD